MANTVVKVYYPDQDNELKFAYCETGGRFDYFVENINSFVGRANMHSPAFEEGASHQQYRMYWVDEDNDKVLINSDYSLRIFLARTGGIKKVYIVASTDFNSEQQKQQPQQQPRPATTDPKSVHQGVQCDHCDALPIIGFRYKCAQCYDFDLCEKCEHKKVHGDHVMYRFPVPLPRNTDLNRRFYKKMRHGCFGRPAEKPDERPRKCGRRRHDGPTNSGASNAFTNFYTMMCDLAEGMDYQNIENITVSTPSAPAGHPEPEVKNSETPHVSNQAPKKSDAEKPTTNNPNDGEQGSFFAGHFDRSYAESGAQALKGFSEIVGKLLDPLGITIEVDVGVKDDKKKNDQGSGSKQTTPEKENAKNAGPEANAGTFEQASQQESTPFGIQTPIIDLLSSPSPPGIVSFQSDTSQTKPSASINADDGIRVFPGTSSTIADKAQEAQGADVEMEIDLNLVEEESNAKQSPESVVDNNANKKRGSSPIESSWTVIDKQFDELQLGGQKQPDQNQTVPSPSASASTPPREVNYIQLSKDLLSHIQAEQQAKQQSPPRPPLDVVHHPDKKINNAVIAMMAMGFSNEGGWLTNLLATVDGDIPNALELLHPLR